MPPLNPFSKSCVALAVSQLLLAPSVLHAATITVNINVDNGVGCTLRDAIASANTATSQGNGCAVGSNNGTDTITFSNGFSSTITLTQGELVVGAGKDIEIDASNINGGIIIDANQRSRVLKVEDSRVSLNKLTITGGEIPYTSGGEGGGIVIYSSNDLSASTVELNNCRVTENYARGGAGGISLNGYSTLNLLNSTVSDNAANENAGGIGMTANSIARIESSLISNNTATGSGRGAGMHLSSNTRLNMINSTVSGNHANFSAGGLFLINSAFVSLENVTISGNTSNRDSGALIANSSTLSIVNSTVASNSAPNVAGIGVAGVDSVVTLVNTILANSVDAADCEVRLDGTIIVDLNSIVGDGTCGANRSGDPGLLPLADNGGPTPTHALAPNSIAIDTGEPSTCLSTDQRGEQRDSQCDVGAFERQSSNTDSGTTTFVIPLLNGKSVIFDL